MIHTRNDTDAVKYQVVLLTVFVSFVFAEKCHRSLSWCRRNPGGATRQNLTGNGQRHNIMEFILVVSRLGHFQVPKAKELFDKASGILGYDLLDKCQNGPKDALDSTVSHA